MKKTLPKSRITQHIDTLKQIIDPSLGTPRAIGNFYDVGLLYKSEDGNIEPLSELTRQQIIKFIGVNAKEYTTLPAEFQTVPTIKRN